MSEKQRRVDAIRSSSSEMENHLIDTYSEGGISRREFVRRGTVMGMSMSALGFLVSACGSGDKGGGTTESTEAQTSAKVKPGGTVKVGVVTPSGAIDPVKVADEGGLAVLGQAGEYLVWSNAKLEAVPRLAESWTPNDDASVWTFKIRQGVKFHDGTPMTAEDVAATINRLADPKSGVVRAVGVRRRPLQGRREGHRRHDGGVHSGRARTGTSRTCSAPTTTTRSSSRKNYDGDYEKTMNGTGPFKLDKYTQGQGATFVKNPDYWDTARKPNPDNTELRFYAKEQAADRRAAERRGRRAEPVLRHGRPGAADRPERPGHRREVDGAPPDAHADRQGAVQGQERAPGAGAGRRPQGPRGRPLQGQGAARQRQPVLAGVPVHRHVGGAAPAGHREGQAAAVRRRQERRLRGHAGHLERLRDPRPRAARPERGEEGRDQHQAQHHRLRRLLRDGCSASRPGWTRRWGSPTTATAASVNVFLGAPLLCKGTWNAAHFKNPTSTTSSSPTSRPQTDIQTAEGDREADPGAAARRDAAS